ncbi:ABC transporter ATP-binding protein [Desulfofustis glycolicus]|uniref:Carbohydrate ABC transporter ATP-binding protein, CUT1 family n=1 Tax=Desulfofustis glycolicus DSM 9705 TaxID=1121409 RepID=A0A1M5TMN7_9BACT|nr:ABC transporter ATP-binding protein [Desulfofustis glycolicus]SHH51974.1 carbohydrate ABC transporter ATP-binding protein, CUT1 family [Desulfofustis glycolicus DSM 9705]
MATITLNDIAHCYSGPSDDPDDYALKQLNLAWRDGGAYALLGPSGCGKTTLLNIISGLLIPTKGRVLFNEQDVTSRPTEQRNIAQIFQFPVIYDTMTVFENLAFPLKNRGRSKKEIDPRVIELARMLDLEDNLHTKACHLTADAKQKISLGRGLIRQSVNAILFDEPLTVIDPQLKWQLRAQLKSLHKQFGFTMIYVTHDQTEALTFADEVVVMYEGEVVQVGTPEALFERPEHTFVGYFIGSPGMNIVPCAVDGDRLRLNGHEIRLGQRYPAPPPGARVELGIRPEYLRLQPPDRDGLSVAIVRVDNVGRHQVARVALGEQLFNVVAADLSGLTGDRASLVIDPARANVYVNDQLYRGATS